MDQNNTYVSRDILASYPAFRYSAWLGKSHAYIIKMQLLVSLIFAIVFSLSAYLDNTLIMSIVSGDAVGFLEHPGIFIYLIAQCIIPYTTLKSISNLLEMPKTALGVLSEQLIKTQLASDTEWFQSSLLLRNNFGKLSYSFLSLLGFTAFVWNCYQNQLPLKFLGFDFWDSAYHPFGYWSTRVYKFYIAVLLAPAVVHVQFILVATVRRILLYAAKNGELRLEPYHPDGCGGVRVFIDSVLNPMIPVLLISSLMTFAAFFVHKKYDLTTVGGLLLTCSLFLLIYLVPAVTLRKAIIVEKRRQLSDVARKQGKFYSVLMSAKPEGESVKEIVEDLDCLAGVGKHISLVPNWPQLQRTVKLVSLAGSSPVLGWAGQKLSVYVTTWLTGLGLPV